MTNTKIRNQEETNIYAPSDLIFRNKIFHTAFAELRMQISRRGVRDVALFFKPAESLTFKPCERLLWRFVWPSLSGRRKRLQSRSLSLEGFGAFVGSEEKFKERERKGNPGRLWRTRRGKKWNGCNLRCCPCSSGWLRLSSLRTDWCSDSVHQHCVWQLNI